MNAKLLAALCPILALSPLIGAPPTAPVGNPPSTPGPQTGEVGARQQVPSSTDAEAGEEGYVIVKGQVYQIAKGHAAPVREDLTVKIVPTQMAVKVSPAGITGLDGKPFEIPPGEMLSKSGRLVARPTGVAGLPAGGAQAGPPRPPAPTPAAERANPETPGAKEAAPARQAAPEGPAGRPGAPAIPGPDKPANAQGSGGYPGGPLNGGERTEKKK